MSQREGAPYVDRVEEDGRVLIYEGHDIGREGPNPKSVDQPETNPDGSLAENVLFFEAAAKYKRGEREPDVVKVYETIRPGIWAYNGLFKLVDAWKEKSSGRHVFKFKLELLGGHDFTSPRPVLKRSDTRMLRERILSLSQSQARKLGIGKSTLHHLRQNAESYSSSRVYGKVRVKLDTVSA